MTNNPRRFIAVPVLIMMCAAAFSLTGLTLGVQSASAHDSLVSSSPAADSNVATTLTQVVLNFSEQPNADFPDSIAIHVADAAGSRVDTGTVVISDRALTVAVAPTTNGMYRVIWQNLSVDGHAISGQFDFSYTGASTSAIPPSSGPSASPSPSSGVDASATPTTPAPKTTLGTDAGDSVSNVNGSLALALGIGILVLGVIAAVFALLTRRRRSRSSIE